MPFAEILAINWRILALIVVELVEFVVENYVVVAFK